MNYVAGFADLSTCAFLPAKKIAKICDQSSGLAKVGAYFLNGVVCLLTVPFCPIVCLINIIAAGILKLGSLCAEEKDLKWFDKEIDESLSNTLEALVGPLALLVGIVFPRVVREV